MQTPTGQLYISFEVAGERPGSESTECTVCDQVRSAIAGRAWIVFFCVIFRVVFCVNFTCDFV